MVFRSDFFAELNGFDEKRFLCIMKMLIFAEGLK